MVAPIVSHDPADRITVDKQPSPAKQARIDAKRRERAPKKPRTELKAEKVKRYWEKVGAFELPDMEAAVSDLMQRPAGLPLDEYSHRLASQHGEDGLTVEVFR